MQLFMSIFCFAGKFITVGWGKKETQFHGSEGKQAAQKKTQVAVQLQKTCPQSNRNVSGTVEAE